MSQKFPLLSVAVVLIGITLLGYVLLFRDTAEPGQENTSISSVIETNIGTDAPESPPSPSPTQHEGPIENQETVAEPAPKPLPPGLDNSDSHITDKLKTIDSGDELISLLTQEEIARKIVRAVYGLSEGRIVRQYRPIVSPETQIIVNKIGQQTENTEEEIYRISRENGSRYTHYISLFSKLNSQLAVDMYSFYLPTLEEAYQELGINKGNFHTTLVKAIDVLLSAPSVDQAILLTRPSVMYKFKDPQLENLPQAHKLMLRMGQENSEALKLELKKLRQNLSRVKV